MFTFGLLMEKNDSQICKCEAMFPFNSSNTQDNTCLDVSLYE